MTLGHLFLTAETVFSLPMRQTTPVKKALSVFARDFAKVFGVEIRTGDSQEAAVIIDFAPAGQALRPESFEITFEERSGRTTLTLRGADDLGVIYGLYHLSGHMFGVDPFWFWADREPRRQHEIVVPAIDFVSPQPRVRFRGWFVNDEVCLIGWTDIYPPPAEVWEPVFETLLRLGGNLVIPGTDLPRTGIHWQLASEMGLYITHHHAEPLGSEMFFRVHPNLDASYDRNPELFEELWREAILRQKSDNVVWSLGFRGQGDCPFWEQDPSYDTSEKRGELISRAIQRQYDILHELVENPACITYLYGEITELYREGHIRFPPNVTKIWSDNGYGRMVSRRQGNHSLRVPSLPLSSDEGPHGLYYHATFHDLQASNHLVMLPVATSLLSEELKTAFDAGADEVLLVNCGNVRPHIYTLDLIAKMWGSEDFPEHGAFDGFTKRYFSSSPVGAAECLRRLISHAIQYGPYEDDMAGDEFYHHPARSLVGHLMRGETNTCAPDLIWATGEVTFDKQVHWFADKCASASNRFADLTDASSVVANTMDPTEAVFFRDLVHFQARLHHSGASGLLLLCDSIVAFREKRYPEAFVRASQSLWAYRESLEAMADAEHGRWKNFFRADWLTNVKSTLYSLEALRRHIRMFGDNPDYFLWHKEYLMPESEKKIYLENTHRNPPSDDDLAKRLLVRFGM
ncbi:glycosyl hydrolase 115 family protein [Rhizobium pusense]|uniref:glycosyl hydrolase 115 family protein n=1 Tax=Agrobacterium pusense TaxID=648995 RepID=UPI0018E4E716|nr:glycosyl hydrolase 115 family protein [Agrobacterium pusense]MDH0912539.1 glycosyl hydrolase 115 family protein [Agrobacterium pusense]MDH1098614.1 glycosyl hydrolase 115 family protein [Agrobacterium pusense]MDH1115227.1 glycosyl hydrolase 115 family protein [Agrobacterium pusense]MDH2197038.1 glycosyl hydrolase 115 family protein [Agrobacterium pusense]